MSKYTHLPDIDTAPDVFETADVPELPLNPDDEKVTRPVPSELDEAKLPERRKAGKVFSIKSALVEDDEPIESTEVKLRRLRAEIAELESNIAVRKEKHVNGLAALQTRLAALDSRQSLDFPDKPIDPREPEMAGNTRKDPEELPNDTMKRLKALEDIIGRDQCETPVVPNMEKLDTLLSIFTQPRQLDAVSRRIKLLLVDLERTTSVGKRIETERVTGATESDQNALGALFNLLPRLDPLLPILDPLLSRLQSLSALHSGTFELADGLRNLRTLDKSAEDDSLQLLASVQEVQAGLGQARSTIDSNLKAVDTRLKSLEDRLEALS